jgi:uncharacterized membrane protein YeaQ/YmgE (transglycosylase-associated protein family)
MKDFNELKSEPKILFESESIAGLTNEEVKQAEDLCLLIIEHAENGTLEDIDEGLIGSIIGGTAGLIAGPALGRAICSALGITQGVLYDVLTSRLVTTAIGAAIGKHV